MPHFTERIPQCRGRLGIWDVTPAGLWLPRHVRHNQVQYTWGHIITRLLGGNRDYRISSLYIEYENVDDPEDPVVIPTFGRDEGREYFSDLSLTLKRDYLRVPLLQDPMVGIESGYEDFFVDGESGNVATFFAMTTGTFGVNGKAFGDGSNSKVCGAALVATPVFADNTQDVVFARAYLAEAEQVLKEASHSVGITWSVVLL